MATTAQCEDADCPEFQVPKDMQFLPPDYPAPVLCGMCGGAIDVSEVDPAPERAGR